MNQIDVVESSGNVFADLGLDDPEILLVKAEMVRLIASASESRGYTEADLAQALARISSPLPIFCVEGWGDFQSRD